MIRIYIAIILLLAGQPVTAQVPVLHWGKMFEEHNVDNVITNNNGRTVGVDQQGNVYAAGLFSHTTDFDPGSGVYALTGGGQGKYGIYISKLDANGHFVWAKQIPVLVEFGSIELKVDKNGNVYLVSDLRHPADMDPGPGVLLMTPIGARDAFVIKLDSGGNLVWVKQFGGPGDTVPQASAVEIDQDGNVIICGAFNQTVDFDPGPNTFNLTASAHMQSFITKLNNNGDFIWAIQFGQAPITYSGAQITDVECDLKGNIYTTGGFKGTCDFDPGTAVYSLTGSSLRDGFVSKLDANGNFGWAKRIGNTTNDYYHSIDPMGIDIDGANNVITTGYFIGTHDFDPGADVYNRSSSASNHEAYILKLNDKGEFSWAKIIQGNGYDAGYDIAVDNDDNIYAVGLFGTSVDFDPGPVEFIINNPHHGASALVKLNAEGNFIYAAPFQSIDQGTILVKRMAVDAAQSVYITGLKYGVIDFDPGPEVHPSSKSGPFVLKLGKCLNATSSAMYVNTCDSYTLNNKTYDTSGTYRQTILNTSGCDSIITLHLTINKKLAHITKTICEGESYYAGGAHQVASGIYKDTLRSATGCDSVVITTLRVHTKPAPNLGADRSLCADSSLTMLPGIFTNYLWQDHSNHSSFTATKSGLYWVMVTDENNCSATDSLRIDRVLPKPSNFLKHFDSLCANSKVRLQPTGNYRHYLWSTGATSGTIEITKTGKYWLSVTDLNGCAGMDTITVFSKQCLSGFHIPTAFTPNGDGTNDVFKPSLPGVLQQYEFIIYNRWGQVVFRSNDPRKGWNGKTVDLAQDNGVFVWTCQYQLNGSKPNMEKGTVMLIR